MFSHEESDLVRWWIFLWFSNWGIFEIALKPNQAPEFSKQKKLTLCACFPFKPRPNTIAFDFRELIDAPSVIRTRSVLTRVQTTVDNVHLLHFFTHEFRRRYWVWIFKVLDTTSKPRTRKKEIDKQSLLKFLKSFSQDLCITILGIKRILRKIDDTEFIVHNYSSNCLKCLLYW